MKKWIFLLCLIFSFSFQGNVFSWKSESGNDISSGQGNGNGNGNGAAVSNAVYDSTAWNGVTDIAPSKNAVRDKIETLNTFSQAITIGGSDQAIVGTKFKIDLFDGTAGKLKLQSTGNSNNEDMTIDLESTPNKAAFGSGSGIDVYEFPQTLKANRMLIGGVSSGSGSGSGGFNVSSKIVSFYKMEDSTNDTTVTDSQGANSATSSGVLTQNMSVAGKINNGFELAGSPEYINLGAGSSLKIAGDMSVAFWINTTQSSTARIAGNRSISGTNVGWEAILVSGQFRMSLDSGSTTIQPQSSTLINTGSWVFVTAVRSGTTLTVYINGISEDTDTLSGDIGTGAGNTYIGRTPLNATYFSGILDNFQIYNAALTDDEVLDLYNGGNGTDSLSGGATSVNTNFVGTTEAVTSTHGLNTLKDLSIEGNLEVQGGNVYITPPASQSIVSSATVTANACEGLKQITNASVNVSSNTTNTFDAPSEANSGCCMNVVNVASSNTVTLDNNSNFKTASGQDVTLRPTGGNARVCSNGSVWYQIGQTGSPS